MNHRVDDWVDAIVEWLDSRCCKNIYWTVMILAALYFTSVCSRLIADLAR